LTNRMEAFDSGIDGKGGKKQIKNADCHSP